MSFDASRYRESMHQFVAEMLEKVGPRESCSDSERELARRLVADWQRWGLAARIERFTCHPKAFLGFVPYLAFFYLMATVFYWLAPFLAVLFAGLALVVTVLELLRYREFIDPLFPSAAGHNAVGVLSPDGPVRRRVIVSAHLDSAYEFNLWFFLKNAGVPVMVIAFAAPAIPFVGGLLKSLLPAGSDPALLDTIGLVSLALYPIVALNFFFHTYVPVPGAMDDLAGVSVVRSVVQAIQEQASTLRHTELLVVGTACEEAGLRGAKRFVERHREDLGETPTYGLFVDGIYDERFLTVIDRELMIGARHAPPLVDLAQRCAAQRQWPMHRTMIPFGATDAAAFSLAGVPSVALLCQDTAHLAPNYHTRLDTLEHVRPESLEVTLQIVLDMIEKIDAGEFDAREWETPERV